MVQVANRKPRSKLQRVTQEQDLEFTKVDGLLSEVMKMLNAMIAKLNPKTY